MGKSTITFRVEDDKKAELDEIADGLNRDRSYVLNEAVSAYIETHRWQIEHIKEGLRQADAGEFASDEEVAESLNAIARRNKMSNEQFLAMLA